MQNDDREEVDFPGGIAYVGTEGVELEPNGERQMAFLTADELGQLYDKARAVAEMVAPLTFADVLVYAQQVQGFPWRAEDGTPAVVVTNIAAFHEGGHRVTLYDARDGLSYDARTRGEMRQVMDQLWRKQ